MPFRQIPIAELGENGYIRFMTLRDYLSKRQMTGREFAAVIGVHDVSVYRYLCGERIPRPKVMARIVAATDGEVGPADFYAQPAAAE